jgi:hypothetical protein
MIVAVELTDVERAMLAFERENTWWEHAGHRETAILERFGIPTSVYGRHLHALIYRPEALAADPLTVKRLRGRAAAGGRSIREFDV